MATYKVAKGDRLEVVAKKHGHADWRVVWSAPENRALAGRRRQPENLQPGDVLHIPPTEKERRDAELKRAEQAAVRAAFITLRGVIQSEIERIPKVISGYDTMVASKQAYTKETLEELGGALAGMKRWANGVDFAAAVALTGADLEKLRRKGKQALGATGEALEKLNKELANDLKKLASSPIKDEMIAAIASLQDSAEGPLLAAAMAADYWDDIHSPSFWANGLVQFFAEDRSWSDAWTSEVGDGIRQRMKEVAAGSTKDIARIRARQNELRAQLTRLRALLAVCNGRIRGLETAGAR